MDKQESDLGILDLIQVFVESLGKSFTVATLHLFSPYFTYSIYFYLCIDKCFENVCELDLIFHSDRINYILDEIIMAGK